jgi:DNA-directed RNA polymerase specialized sigma24 family protein
MSCEQLDLTPLQLEACVMYYGKGMRLTEIAEAQGCNFQMVSKRIRAARRKYPALSRQYHRRAFNPFA